MTAAVAYTAAERAAKREEIRQRLLAAAEVEAHRLARSYACHTGGHMTCVGHLRANGGHCLCECHDREATP